MEENTVTVYREDGSETAAEVLLRFSSGGTDYIITEDPDDPDGAICFRCAADGDLSSIETDEEYDLADRMLDEYYS